MARRACQGRPEPARRRLIGAGLATAGSLLVSACVGLAKGAFEVAPDSATGAGHDGAEQGRLLTRPAPPTAHGPLGVQAPGLADGRDSLLYVPAGYHPDQPAPLVVSLHGASGTAQRGLALLQSLADAAGLLVLAPASRGRSWDVVLGGFGPDVAFIDRALAWTFDRYTVDSDRLIVAGVSDGASYALSLGLTNGDLFTQIVAFSPGFAVPAARRGAPRPPVRLARHAGHGAADRPV